MGVEGEGRGTQDGGVARLTYACQANDMQSWIMTVVATDDYILATIFLSPADGFGEAAVTQWGEGG